MTKLKLLTVMLTVSITSLFAQKNNLVNTWNYLRSKELDKAKTAIDAAAQNDDTKNSPKMWLYRAQTYMAIMESKEDKYKNLDPDAAEKAFTAVVNCFKTDKDKVYYDDAKGMLMPASVRLYNRSIEAFGAKEYDNAIRYTTALFEGLPFDKDDAMKHQNITADKLNYQLFSIAYSAKNFTLAKEYLQKLIDVKYKDPNIYLNMAGIYENEGNAEKQLSYIEQGRNLFDDNVDLITAELNYYIKQNKIDVLLDKVSKAIEAAPDNEILHYTQGNIYQGKNELDKAEAAYKKAIELKPDYGDANYNLGKLYLDRGINYNNTANNLPPKESKKAQELSDKGKGEFVKAIPYLEKAHSDNPKDGNVTKALLQLYVTTGDNDKYAKLKEEMKNNK